MTKDHQPEPVDLYVGARVRARRKFLGVSQEQLADALNISFQQVQKYERGANRISASRLFEIARFLSAPVSHFFDGLDGAVPEGPVDSADDAIRAMVFAPGGAELASDYRHLDQRSRDVVRATARRLRELGSEIEAEPLAYAA